MAYKPKNLASFTDKSTDYAPGGRAGGRAAATVPGTTGSDDRQSQGADVEFKDQGQVARPNPDFALADGGMNDRLDPRQNPTHGQRSYPAQTPTL